MTIKQVTIRNIKVENRIRKDIGDLQPLAESMAEGVLQPIGITPDKVLIFGERRLCAARDILGWKTIPARIVDVESVLHGQFAENILRKEYTVTERVAIVEALRSFKHGGDRRSKQARKRDDESLTIDEASKRAGLGGKDGFARAKKVIDNGVPELREAMDEGRIAVSKAAEIARLPEEDQRESAKFGRKVAQRDPHDFYPTPPEVTRALLAVEEFDGEIWEPACGDGAISKVLNEADYSVMSSDLVDRGYGNVEDFLTARKMSDNTVTNPPFKLSEEFIKKALACSRRKVAMFLPLTFLEGQDRNELLRRSPLKTVYVFVDRVTLPKGGIERRGHGRAAFAWYVWEHGYKGNPQIQWVSTADSATVVKSQKRPSQVKAVLPMRKPIRVNSVVEGDCRELISRLDDGSVNLGVCSPPYGNQRNDMYPGIPDREFPDFMVRWMSELWPKLNDNGSVLIVIRPDLKKGTIKDYVLRSRLALRDAGWNECEKLIWFKPEGGGCQGSMKRPRRTYEEILWFSKTHDPFCDPKACGGWSDNLSCRGSTRFGVGEGLPIHGMGNGETKSGRTRAPDVFVVPMNRIANGIMHPAMFPVELAEQLIQTFCPPGSTVLDPFAGSGSTLIAAKKLGHDYYGFDIMPDYCKIARKRLAATIRGGGTSKAG